MRIKTLLITVLTCFIIIPSVAFAIAANMQMDSLALQNYSNAAKSMTEKQAVGLSQYFATLSGTAKQIATDPYITRFTKDNVADDKIEAVIKNYTSLIKTGAEDNSALADLARIFICDDYGEIFYGTGDETVLAEIKSNVLAKSTLRNIIFKNKESVPYCYNKDIYAQYSDDDKEKADPLFPKDDSDYSDVKLVVKYKSGSYNVVVFFSYARLRDFSTDSQFTNNTRLVMIDAIGSIIDGAYHGNVEDANLGVYKKFTSVADQGSTKRVDNFKGTAAADIPTIGFTIRTNPVPDTEETWCIAVVSETDKAYKA